MPRKSGRLSRFLTERSRFAAHPEDSEWIDYLDDTRGTGPPGTLDDKTRLSEGAPRRSKWWVDLGDSVNVPPPLTAELGSESDSPFSSGAEMSGKRPAPRREILRAAKRKRGTDEGFADVFDEDEPATKRKSSSLKRSSPESVPELASPVVQPRRGEKKGALFRKRGRRDDAKNKSGNSRFERVFNDGDDEVSSANSRRVQDGSVSDRSVSPDVAPARRPKKVLDTRKSRTRSAKPNLEVTFSDDDDDVPKKQSSVFVRSPSPAAKTGTSGRKDLLARKSRSARPDLQVSFSEDEDGNPHVIEATKRSSVADRSPSPAAKTGTRGKKDLLKRKSRSARPDLEVSFSDDEEIIPSSSKYQSQRSLSQSPSPASKPGKQGKKNLLARKSRSARPDLQVSFSDDEDDVPKKQSGVSERSPSPASKSQTRGKKDLLKRKSRNSRPDLQVSFSDDDDGNSKTVEATKRSSASVRSPSPDSEPRKQGRKDLLKRKSWNSRPDLEIAFSDDEDVNSNVVEATKRSSVADRNLSPRAKPAARGKKYLLARKSRNTRPDLEIAFSDDDDEEIIPSSSKNQSQRSVSQRSLSPASKSGRLAKKDVLTGKSRDARPDVEMAVSDGEDGNIVEPTKRSSASARSPSPAKPATRGRKMTLLKTRKTGTTSVFDDAFSDDEEIIPSSSRNQSQLSKSQSPSPVAKAGPRGKKDLLKRKSRNARPDLEVAFSDDEVGNSNPVEPAKRSSASVRSPSPASEPQKQGKKNLLARKSRNTRPDLEVAFSEDEDDVRQRQSSVSERSPSPPSKPAREKKDLLKRKSRSARPDLEVSFSNDEEILPSSSKNQSQRSLSQSPSPTSKPGTRAKKDLLTRKSRSSVVKSSEVEGISHSREESKRLSYANQSPIVSRKRGSSKLLPPRKPAASDAAFDGISFSDDDKHVDGATLGRSASHRKDRTVSDTKKLTKDSSKRSDSTSFKDNTFDNNQGSSGSKVRSVSKRFASANHPFVGRNELKNVPSPGKTVTTQVDRKRDGDKSNLPSSSEHSVESQPSDANTSKRSKNDKSYKSPGGYSVNKSFLEDVGFEQSDRVAPVGSASRAVDSSKHSNRVSHGNTAGFDKGLDDNDEIIVISDTDKNSVSSAVPSPISPVVDPRDKVRKNLSRKSGGSDMSRASDKGGEGGSIPSKGSMASLSTAKGSTSRSRMLLASDPDPAGLRSKSRNESDKEAAGKVSVVGSLDRSRRSGKDMAAETSQRSVDARKEPPITPLGKSVNMPFAQDANFTNFNPQANSTKMLHMSKSMLTEPSPGPSSRNVSNAGLRRTMNTSSRTPRVLEPSTAVVPPTVAPRVSANVLPARELSKDDDGSDGDRSLIESWSDSGQNINVSVTPPPSSKKVSLQEATTSKSLPRPAVQPPVEAPPAAPKEKYTPEEAAARRKEYFATILERAKKSYPQFAPGAPRPPIKQREITDFYPSVAALPKPRKERKPVDPSLMVNGKRWCPPKLARPARWCTDRLYSFIQKRTEALYGELKKRRKSEEFMIALASCVKKAVRCKKNFEPHVLRVVYLLKRLGLIETLMDFYAFVENYMPGEFSDAAVPKARGRGKISGPKCFIDANVVGPIDFKKFPHFEK